MNLKSVKQIHFTGIKGVGLASLAFCAKDLNIKVSGSDIEEEFVTDQALKKHGINWTSGFKPEDLPANWRKDPGAKKTSLLIYTAAHKGPKNPQVTAAEELGIPTLSHAQAVGLFMQSKQGISVCGVGGKTTTSSMIATLLDSAKLEPSFAIGVGNIDALGSPGRYNQSGKYFIAEADEYFASPGIDDTPKFLYQHPQIIVVTNIEYDHPDVYKSFKHTQKAYLQFFKKLPKDGILVVNADNSHSLKVARDADKHILTYGFHPHADFHIKDLSIDSGKTTFTLSYKNFDFQYQIPVPGKFNVLNATAAIAVASHLGVDVKLISQGISKYTGCMRRFQTIGKTQGITVVDDYAHHPTEIKATLKAAASWFKGQKITAIFQPHTYSRTKALFSEFAQSFTNSDQIIFIPIYASARETTDTSVSSFKLAEATKKYHPNVLYQEKESDLIKYLDTSAKSGDVIITLGAGDIFILARKILKSLKS